MGWCSGTYIFDALCSALLVEGVIDKEDLLLKVANLLEDNDWDCQGDSDYYDNPTVQNVFRKLHPNWFEGN